MDRDGELANLAGEPLEKLGYRLWNVGRRLLRQFLCALRAREGFWSSRGWRSVWPPQIQKLPLRLGRRVGPVDQAMGPMPRPIHVVARAPTGLAFDAVLPVHHDLRLAEIVRVALVHLRGTDVPERRFLDFGALLEQRRTIHFDVGNFLAQVA